MHHIYHTDGIILSSKNFGESGKYFNIFTRDLGLIRASASGVRKISSKLRYILIDYAYIKVDLVRGRDFWRITSASKTNQLEDMPKNTESYRICANVSRLLLRLLQGEEAGEELFSDVLHGFLMLEKIEGNEDRAGAEAVLVLRILDKLGYVGEGKLLEEFARSPFERELVYRIKKDRLKILKEINKAIKETHL